MWGDRTYIPHSVKYATEDYGIEVAIVEIDIRAGVVYIVLKSPEGVFLAEYRGSEDGTATRIDE
jgi:hypothetical protein